jgi:hypothetical protein
MITVVLLFIGGTIAIGAAENNPALIAVRSLLDESKIATLKGERVCNDRLLKVLYWLHEARTRGEDLGQMLDVTLVDHSRPQMTKDAILRNVKICDGLGIFTPSNLDGMRRGKSPIITWGPYAGEIVEIDHILPFAKFPQYDREFWNLEIMPQTLNRRKGDTVGQRQIELLRRAMSRK